MKLAESLQHLKDFTFAIHPLSDEEWNDFSIIWSVEEAKRKTILTTNKNLQRFSPEVHRYCA
jgi:hypothetical protein